MTDERAAPTPETQTAQLAINAKALEDHPGHVQLRIGIGPMAAELRLPAAVVPQVLSLLGSALGQAARDAVRLQRGIVVAREMPTNGTRLEGLGGQHG